MDTDDRLFAMDRRLREGTSRVDIGEIYVPSGRLYCCDPFLSREVGPLDRCTAPGSYLASIGLVEVEGGWGKRVGFAELFLSDEIVSHWIGALYQRDNKMYSAFPVDAGLACFMDRLTENLFRRVVDEFYRVHPQGNYYDDVLASGFAKSALFFGHSGDWLLHFPRVGDPLNIVMFASGLGDGNYPIYWGIDRYGEPCRLLVDFGLLE
jgi:uncharacterized protein DUF4241